MKFNESMLRLYAVTDRSWLGTKTLAQQVEEAILGGATMVQLREKELDDEAFLAEAAALKAVCNKYQIPFIINDRVELALKVGADGVHVGQEDMQAQDVRALIGKDMILGVTAKTVEQALAAQKAGADYLGSGAVFGSSTKTNALPISREKLHAICDAVSIPVVAIGGIHKGNILELKETGIRGAAIVSGIFAAPDIRKECEELYQKLQSIID